MKQDLNFSIDCFTKMGKQHSICEDYVTYGVDPFPYVVLADGCSTVKNSDIGARILTCVTIKLLKLFNKDAHKLCTDLKHLIIHDALEVVSKLDLEPSCLTATLIIAYTSNQFVHIYMYGDGYIFMQDKEGLQEYYSISYENNAPNYLLYQVQNPEYNTKKSINLITTRSGCTIPSPDASTEIHLLHKMYPAIMIASDGFGTFTQSNNFEKLNTFEVVKEALAFKTVGGKFITRRLRKMVKTYEKNGIYHFDDISIGGFHLL